MEGKRVQIFAAFMLTMTMLGFPLMIMAHLPPATCIGHCLKECKLAGIDVSTCIKYCPVHCLPPDTSTEQRYCSLGCMLDQCAKSTNDEMQMSHCISNCHEQHCKIGS
ncbi:hypothetical protein CDL12_15777 [Handroanthus impetiginosus]|uniref:Uncharacterized protein n=1 Tax=Handroanthus impetiginosus TaxID=429701 RepID=A0A2G9H2A3_9LAMI|nr:hypothetical protein CDL12_15777 [Handroanthus impetiginosus]